MFKLRHRAHRETLDSDREGICNRTFSGTHREINVGMCENDSPVFTNVEITPLRVDQYRCSKRRQAVPDGVGGSGCGCAGSGCSVLLSFYYCVWCCVD
jgi:hypothetical protein